MSGKKFTVYKSSAGSGKTYTLVKEYLKLILQSDNPNRYKHILAITFTNKAANEMKERVMTALNKLSAPNNNDEFDGKFFSDIQNYVGLGTNELRNRSAKILEQILHNYSDLSISTIDKFVHKILKSFARDLRLSLDFEVEIDVKNVLEQVVDILISKIGEDKEITDLLLTFAEHKSDQDKSWKIDQDLLNVAYTITKEESDEFLSQLKPITVEGFQKQAISLKKYVTLFEQQLRSKSIEAMHLIRENGIAETALSRGKSGVFGYFNKLAKGDLKSLTPNSYVVATIEEDKWYSTKAGEDQKSSIDLVKQDLITIYKDIQQLRTSDFKKYVGKKLLLENIYSVAVLNELDKILQQVKKERNLVLISDFNKKISEVVTKEPAPFIYERLGERFRNYLLDEFQDTSVMQWQNLLPLLENTLATGNFNLIVGDSKQAIYRFRSGEAEQFVQLPNVYNHKDNPLVLSREETLKQNYDERTLNTNYRSAKEVVEFNNVFFDRLLQGKSEEVRETFKDVEQVVKHEDKTGYVEAQFFIPEKGETDNQYYEYVKETINQSVGDGYTYSDIVVLVRNNKNGNKIANFLNDHDIPVLSSDSLLLHDNSKIKFLISFLRFLIHSEDEVAKLYILEYWAKEKKRALHDIHREYSFVNERNRRVINLNQFFSDVQSNIKLEELAQLSLFSIVEKAVISFDLEVKGDGYIQFFQETVYNFTTKNGNDIHHFIDWWDSKEGKLSIQMAEQINAVQIMTIHKSKGLQFPIVIVPYLNWRIDQSSGKDLAWVSLTEEKNELPAGLVRLSSSAEDSIFSAAYTQEKDKLIQDSINLLYVAFTRPEDRLYLFSDLPSSGKANSSSITGHVLPELQKMEGWSEEDARLIMGERVTVSRLKEKDASIISIERPIHQDSTRSRLQISFQAPEVWDIENVDENKEYGKLVHKVFASINHNEDVDDVLSKYLLEGIITPKEMKDLKLKINRLLGLPIVAPWFKKGVVVKAEAAILDKKGNLHRPDRVIIDGEKATVIDFKTGVEGEGHHQQVRKYADLLLTMGYFPVDKFLLYTETGKVSKID